MSPKFSCWAPIKINDMQVYHWHMGTFTSCILHLYLMHETQISNVKDKYKVPWLSYLSFISKLIRRVKDKLVKVTESLHVQILMVLDSNLRQFSSTTASSTYFTSNASKQPNITSATRGDKVIIEVSFSAEWNFGWECRRTYTRDQAGRRISE